MDDATYAYSVAMPVMPVDSNGVNEDSSLVFSTHLKVTLSSQGLPVVRIDTAGNTVNTSLNTSLGGSLTNSTAPTLAGAAVVGQTLYATQGTYNATPDSITPTWTVGGSAITDATGDALLILDSYQGLVIGYSEVAHKTGYTDSPSNAATNTGAVAAIDLSNQIISITRTSASGAVPMVVDIALGSKVYAGYFLDRIVYTDSGLTTLKGATMADATARHELTNDGLVAGATIDWSNDGGPSIAATDWVQYVLRTTSPNAVPYMYTYPTAISPTDAVVPMHWSTTDDYTPGGTITFSNNNCTVAVQSGNPYSFRTNRVVGYDLTYWEITGSPNNVGVADATQDLTVIPGSTADGNVATTHAGVYQNYGTGDISYNGSLTAVGGWTGTDTLQFALDRVNKKIWFGKNNTWLNGTPGVSGGLAMASIGTMYPFLQAGFSQSATANFGTTPGGTAGFTYTPPTGFVAP